MNPNNNEDNNTNVIDKENLSPTPTATHNKQHNLSQFLVDSCPLASTRDPRRKELLNRLPFSPNNEQTFSSDDKKKDPNRNNGKRRVLTPAYAYKNAKTGLLEISTIHPPSPSVVAREEAEEDEVIKDDLAEENDQDENQNCKALLPALYPIALNGGGCGIYTHPSDFGSNTRTPLTTIGESNSNSHQSIEKEVEGMIQDMRSNHTTYHNNTNLQKLGNRRAPLSSYVAFQEYQNEDESRNHQRIRGDQDHTLVSSVDQHKAHDLETGTLKEHQKPWKIWEKIHMDMSRRTPPSSLLSSSSSPQKSHQKKKKKQMMTMTMQSPLSTNAVVPDDISANASDCGDDDLPKVPPTSNHYHVGRISSVYNDDDFDFALVLTPQRVYEFWANHLDFRGEHYSHDDQGHDEIDCNDYFQPIYHKNTPSSFISPQPTTTTTMRISQRRLTATNVIMTDEKSSEMMNCTPSYYNTPTPITFQQQQQQQRNVDEYGRRTFTRRKSLFERALERLTPPSAKQKGQTQQYMMGSPTPTTSTRKTSSIMYPPRSRMRSILKGNTPIEQQQQQQQQHQSNTSLIISSSSKKKKLKRGKGMENSVFLGSTTPMTNNHHNPSNNTNTNTGGVSANKQLISSSSDKRNNRNKQGLITNDTNNEEKDDEIFFPSQVIPRGIAARNNGMQEFLQALHRGIVVKRHVSNGEAEFVKLSSSDGGDNITYHYIPPEEALPALKEQRVRFNNRGNKKFKSKQDTTIHDNRWYHSFHNQNNHNNHHTNIHNGHGNTLTSHDTTTNNNNIPNAVVAQNQAKITSGRIFSAISDYSTKFIHSGKAHARDIIAVHPARHVDPFSARKYAESNNDTEDDEENIQFGTASLRNSHSPYSVDCTFSLILPQKKVKGAIYGALDTLERGIQTATGRNHDNNQNEDTTGWTNIEKWYSGQGSMTSFRTLDFECATQGEYWVIFRGFLLLHRDAASGRFATQRASGFSSHYSRKEEDARQRTDKNDPSSPNFVWPEEEYERNYRKKKASDFQNVKAPPSDYFLGFKSRGTQIWSRLRQAGLETQRVYSLDTKRVMIKLRCPAERLQDVAEVLNIKLKSANGSFHPFLQESITSQFFFSDELDRLFTSQGGNGTSCCAANNLFRSSERQSIIDFIIRSRIRDSGAELGKRTDLGKHIEMSVPLHKHAKLEPLYSAWVLFWSKSNWVSRSGKSMKVGNEEEGGVVHHHHHHSPTDIPMGDEHLFMENTKNPDMKPLLSEITIPSIFHRLFIGSFYQPLDSIQEYYGEGVAFYFAWLQHCSQHLVFLSIFGLIVFLLQLLTGELDNPLRLLFSIIIMVWGFVVMVTWRRRSNFLAHRWGTLNYEEEETTRPQFKGEYRKDEITQEWVIFYPSWKRYLKYCVSVPLTMGFTVAALMGILMWHANRDMLLARYYEHKENTESFNESTFHWNLSINSIGQKAPLSAVNLTDGEIRDPTFWMIVVGFPSVLSLCYPLLNYLLMKISIWLNEFENYRTESQYRNSLILKVFTYKFGVYFASLYYYSFLMTGRSEQDIENRIFRVAASLVTYLTVSHWWNIFVSIYSPLLLHRWRLHRERLKLRDELRKVERMECESQMNKEPSVENVKAKAANQRILLEHAQDSVWEEIMLQHYDPFYDYVMAVIQFGFVTCFSVVLPLTPVLCLINNLMSMRLDAYKLCRGRRRPLVHKSGGIGVWEHVLHIVTIVAVLTNCSLMALTSKPLMWLGDKIGNLWLFFVVVAWEHLMLLIKYIMQAAFPTMPKSVMDDKKREKFIRNQQNRLALREKKERRSGSAIISSPRGGGGGSGGGRKSISNGVRPCSDSSTQTTAIPNHEKKRHMYRNNKTQISLKEIPSLTPRRVDNHELNVCGVAMKEEDKENTFKDNKDLTNCQTFSYFNKEAPSIKSPEPLTKKSSRNSFSSSLRRRRRTQSFSRMNNEECPIKSPMPVFSHVYNDVYEPEALLHDSISPTQSSNHSPSLESDGNLDRDYSNVDNSVSDFSDHDRVVLFDSGDDHSFNDDDDDGDSDADLESYQLNSLSHEKGKKNKIESLCCEAQFETRLSTLSEGNVSKWVSGRKSRRSRR